jgi:pilus assembly protein CpaC
MTKDRLFFLISFAFLGLAAAFLFRPHATQEKTSLPTTIEALVALQDLKVGNPLPPSSYRWEKIDFAAASDPLLVIRNPESEKLLAEAKVAKEIHKGDKIKRYDLDWPQENAKEQQEAEVLPAEQGKRAVPLALSSMSAIVQFMSPGMFVDITFTSRSDIGFGTVNLTLFKNIRILAIGSETDGKNNSWIANKANTPVEILLEMTPREAELLSYAKEAGTLSFDINTKPGSKREQHDRLSEMLLNSSSSGSFHSTLVTYMIRTLFPEVKVDITATPKGYIVAGKAPNQKTEEKILEVLEKLTAGGDRAIVNMIEVDVPPKNILKAQSGKRAVPFEIPSWSSMVQYVSPGMYVDVTFISKEDIGFGTVSLTLLKNIRILAIQKEDHQIATNGGAGHPLDSRPPIEVLLEMTPKEAELLFYAKQAGTLSFDLNGANPSNEHNELSEMLLKSSSSGNFHSVLVTYMIRSLFPDIDISITATPKGYIVAGQAPNQKTAEKILEVLDKLASGGDRAVVNMMDVQQRPKEMLSVRPGKRAVPFEIPSWSGMADYIKPGMYVDVTFTSKQDIGFGTVSLTLLRNIRILAIDKEAHYMTDRDREGVPHETPAPIEVLLEMTPKETELLSYARQVGVVSFDLNGANPTNEHDELSEMLLNSLSEGNFHSALVTHMVRSLFPHVNVQVTATPKGYIVSGKVPDPQIAGKIMEILQKLASGGDQAIVNLMEVDPQQVLICVKVFEIQKDVTTALGLNWQALFQKGGETLAFAATFPRPDVTDANYFFDLQGLTYGKWTLSAIVDMLETDGYGRILAEPNLTTVAGMKAEFFAGGEFPILIPQGGTLAGTVTVDYKKYGVLLDFTPQVDLNGLITLHVAPEVSQIDPANSVTLSGFVIPAITARRADTTVKLWPGQSYVIAGLLLDEIENTNTNLYGLDKIPIIGSLFRSENCDDKRTELMILLTPYLLSADRPVDYELPVCTPAEWDPSADRPSVWEVPDAPRCCECEGG